MSSHAEQHRHSSTYCKCSYEEDEDQSQTKRRLRYGENVSSSDITEIVEELTIAQARQLYEKLQIAHKIVEKCEKSADSTDPDEKAKSVLRYWVQLEGNNGTRRAILDGLDRCKFRQAKQNLEKKWQLTDGNKADQGLIKIESSWTPDGLCLKPEVSGFEDWNKVNISYKYEKDGQEQCEDFLYSQQPHILKAVKNTWSGSVKATASDGTTESGCQTLVQREFDLKKLKNSIKDVYRRKLRPIVLLPWQEHHHQVRTIDDIYVELELEKAERRDKEVLILSHDNSGYGGEASVITKEDFLRLGTSGGKHVKRILLKGLAGSGKSCLLSKIAYEWSQDEESQFKKYELVFLLRMNRFENDCHLIDEICKQIIPIDESVKQGLKHYINQNPSELITLMDAWDETKIENIKFEETYQGNMTIEQILASQKLPQTLVIVSSRPHKPLGTIQSEYAQIDIKGFSYNNIKTYIWKFFGYDPNEDTVAEMASQHGKDSDTEMDYQDYMAEKVNPDSVKEMIDQVYDSENLSIMAKVPIILMILCTVWKYTQNFPDTMFCLYDTFMNIIWKRYKHSSKTKSTKDIPFQTFQSRLGQIALQGLLSEEKIEEDNIEFPEEIFGDNICELGLQVGYITKGWNFTFEEKAFITFLHKSVQEFLAGKYFAQMYEENENEFKAILERLDRWQLILDKFEILRFCCGVPLEQNKSSNLCSSAIIDHAIRIYGVLYGDRNVSLKLFQRKDCCCCNEHTVSYLNVGDMSENDSNHAHAIDCLPILTLLHEAKLQDTKTICSLTSDSMFSRPMSVAIECSEGMQPLFLFRNFLQRTRFSSVKSIKLVKKSSRIRLKSAVDLISDILKQLSTVSDTGNGISHIAFDSAYMAGVINHLGAVMTSHLTCLLVQGAELRHNDINVLSGYLYRSPKLRSLHLSWSRVVNTKSIDALTHSLTRNCKYLQDLNLESNCIKTINNLPETLQNLNLGQNDIQTIDILPETLQNLDLSGNNIRDNVVHLIETLKSCNQLKVLLLISSNLTNRGVIVLGRNLHHWPQLLELNLTMNKYIGASGLHSILEHIHHLPKLRSFDIYANDKPTNYSTLVRDCIHEVGEQITRELFIELYDPEKIRLIQNISKSSITL